MRFVEYLVTAVRELMGEAELQFPYRIRANDRNSTRHLLEIIVDGKGGEMLGKPLDVEAEMPVNFTLTDRNNHTIRRFLVT